MSRLVFSVVLLLVFACILSASASPFGVYGGAITTRTDTKHYWPLDDNTAMDPQNGLDGTPTATTAAIIDQLGRSGKAMGFNGTDSHVNFPSNSLTLQQSGTLEAFVKWDATTAPTNSKYVIAAYPPSNRALYLRNRSGTTSVLAGFGDTTNGPIIRDTFNQWRYYAITWEPSGTYSGKYDIRTYYSGAAGTVLIGGASTNGSIGGGPPANSQFNFGCYSNPTTTASHFTGGLDNVAMYTGVLSQRAMQNHIAMATFAASEDLAAYQQTVLNTPGLMHYWPLDNLATEDVVGLIDEGDPTSLVKKAANAIGQADAAIEFVPEARIAFSENLDLQNEGTLEFWLRPDAAPTNTVYAISARSAAGSSDRLYVKPRTVGGQDTIEFGFASNPSCANLDIDGRVGTGEWMLVGMTWIQDPGTGDFELTTYVSDPDGIMQANSPLTIVGGSVAQSPLFFGRYALGGNYYDGGLDEVAIYSRALGLRDFQGHYNRMFGIPEPSTYVLLLIGSAAAVLLGRRKRAAT